MKKIEFGVGDKEWLRKFENRLLFALYVAYLEARKGGKRGTKDEHRFELNADENLIKLRDDILAKTYRPSRSTAHIIHNPVIREIFAATFRDRVVHHHTTFTTFATFRQEFYNLYLSVYDGSYKSQYTTVFYRPLLLEIHSLNNSCQCIPLAVSY